MTYLSNEIRQTANQLTVLGTSDNHAANNSQNFISSKWLQVTCAHKNLSIKKRKMTLKNEHVHTNICVFHTDERERSVRNVHIPYPTVVMVVTAQYIDAMYCESSGESMIVFFPILKDETVFCATQETFLPLTRSSSEHKRP